MAERQARLDPREPGVPCVQVDFAGCGAALPGKVRRAPRPDEALTGRGAADAIVQVALRGTEILNVPFAEALVTRYVDERLYGVAETFFG